ncbi:deleted in malignant brain tumors 1 protein isoform X4 [Nematostella vectensis]|uniref:deleted in malignant brain tumors 1 protein isoform X4 n=1 Tax=Nematostella vectensis TaxID=45351 RepID=UPI0020773538|nr:deleted in malignant brain tumors 1 protein isoform X4 [Nematostella vectensis]
MWTVLLFFLALVRISLAAPVPVPHVRLVGGSLPSEGRVEVLHDGAWGTVCDDEWDIKDGNVVCRSLGYRFALQVKKYGSFGPGSGPIHMDNVRCKGTEKTLTDCEHVGWGDSDCFHSEDAGVVCYEHSAPPLQWRLVGGNTPYEGRVEVSLNGTWGTLCDTLWDMKEADIVCRTLGFQGARKELAKEKIKKTKGRKITHLNYLLCDGDEKSLEDCAHAGWLSDQQCPGEDVRVICEPDDIQLAPTQAVTAASPQVVSVKMSTKSTVTAPATRIIMTNQPMTGEAMTNQPMTEKTMTNQPMTDEPTNQPTIEKATNQPMTNQPMTEESMTNQPTTEEAMTSQLITEEAMTNQPMTEEAMKNEQMTEEATNQPMTGEAMTNQPMTGEAMTNQHMTKEAMTNQPTTDEAMKTQPMTEKAMTNQPMTEEAMTNQLMTEEAMKNQPMTGEAMTDQPMTEEAMTNLPMTEEAMKNQPMTGEAMTNQPMTEEAMKNQPMTGEAMTDEPMTEEAMTNEPMTEEAMTNQPMTGEAMTNEPMTEDATTNQPMTGEAMTNEPMTEEALTNQPMTEEAMTNEPITGEAMTNEPMTEEGLTNQPITGEAMTNKPMTGEAMTSEPMTEEAMTNQPMTGEAMTNEPTTKEAMTNAPMTGGAMTNQPMTGEAMTNQPMTEKTMTNQPMTEEAMTDQPMTGEAMKNQPMTEEAMTNQPMTGEAMTNQQMTEEAMTNQPMTGELMTNQPMTGDAMTNDPMTEEAMTNQPMTGEAMANQPMTGEAMTNEPMTEVAMTNQPMTGEVITNEPMTGEAMTNEPMTGEAMTNEPMTEVAMTNQPMTGEVMTNEPMTVEAMTNQPMTGEAMTNQPMTGEATTNQPMTEEAMNNHQMTELAMKNHQMTEESMTNQPMTEVPMETVTENQVAEKTMTKKPTTIKQTTSHPSTQRLPLTPVQSNFIRLSGGKKPSEGRVEVFYNNTWGTVCDDSWQMKDANVVCRMLGFPYALQYTQTSSFGGGSGPIWMDNVGCRGNESSLADCQFNGWGVHNCDHEEDAGVVCNDGTVDIMIRLAGGKRPTEGRVEVAINGVWGTVCDDFWSLDSARVVCRSLGFPGAKRAHSNAYFGAGTGPIQLDDVICDGSETSLTECERNGLGLKYFCGHHEDAGVECEEPITTPEPTTKKITTPVPSTSSPTPEPSKTARTSMATEVNQSTTARLLKTARGSMTTEPRPTSISNQTTRKATAGSMSMRTSFVTSSTRVTSSPTTVKATSRSTRTKFVPRITRVTASPTREARQYEVRLSDGKTPYEGRVEIYYNGKWGTVCDDSWGIDDGHVVCRSLGYASALQSKTKAYFGPGTGVPIHLDDVGCTGKETGLEDCRHKGWGVHNCGHQEDAGVVCNDGSVPVHFTRLVGGKTFLEGRVEVYHNGAWGTVCDDEWSISLANVVCRSLGFSFALQVRDRAAFGEGTGPIHMDNVHCTGSEMSLVKCGHRGWGISNCQHKEDVGVVCSERQAQVRLVNGDTPLEGRVELSYLPDTWGTVCDDSWDIQDAHVVCRSLGYHHAVRAIGNGFFGRGRGDIYLSALRCRGTEKSLVDCEHTGFHRVPGCGHIDDAGVVCANQSEAKTASPARDTDVPKHRTRLVGGRGPYEGRVEVWYGEEWGTVCDDEWDFNDANVVCKSLGFPAAKVFHRYARYGQGAGRILLDNVECTGSERSVVECPHQGWGVQNCHHSEDAGVECRTETWTELPTTSITTTTKTPTATSRATTTEAATSGATTTEAATTEATTATTTEVPTTSKERPSSRPTMTKSSSTTTFTTTRPLTPEIIGANEPQRTTKIPTKDGPHVRLRLMDGKRASEGRVEVLYDGEWGTICDNLWDVMDAHVVCRSLGYHSARKHKGFAFFGHGEGRVLLEGVQCTGKEDYLDHCPHMGWGVTGCGHHKDAGVMCYEEEPPTTQELLTPPITQSKKKASYGDIRLVGGFRPSEGRVEIYHNGVWGTVCDDQWDINAAHVVCRSLGYRRALEFKVYSHFGKGEEPTWLDDVVCRGSEKSLNECRHAGWGVENCAHSEDAGVVCEEDVPYTSKIPTHRTRLIGGSRPSEGRVEVFYNGAWGTVCDDLWDEADASVVCKSLGYPGARSFKTMAYFGRGSGPIVLDNVECRGYEDAIGECPSRGWGVSNCGHKEDAGVVCMDDNPDSKTEQPLFNGHTQDAAIRTRLVGGIRPSQGRLEVFYDGRWGTVCNDLWSDTNANVVCKSLGFGESHGLGFMFGAGSGPILMDDVICSGNEASLVDCSHRGWGVEDCEHREDVGVVCSENALARTTPTSAQKNPAPLSTTVTPTTQIPTTASLPTTTARPSTPAETTIQSTTSPETTIQSTTSPETTIQSTTSPETTIQSTTSTYNKLRTRLVAGNIPSEGRVEVLNDGVWGTVCDDLWSMEDAHVVCRSLGFQGARDYKSHAFFGRGTGPIWLDGVRCRGSEESVLECEHRGIGIHMCGHHEDAGVVCITSQ